MANPWIPALFGFLGAIIGGLINAYFSRRNSTDQFVRDSRQRDYNVFVEAIAGMSQAAPDSTERKQFVAKAIEAKGKIILNSSPNVLDALAKYSAHGALASEESYTDFSNLLTAMRADIGGEASTGMEKKIRAILFEGTTK
jgi:hypothetical protein